MRVVSLTLLSLALAPCLLADPLTQADREALKERLQKIQDVADAKLDARFRVAVAAFRAGMVSDEAAFDLYLKCTEKVQFEDEHKKGQDFREWKRKEDGKLSSVSFRRALRYQLRWLVLTLQVASKDEGSTAFAPEAARIVDELFSDLKSLDGQQGALQQGVTGTVFAQAYNLKDLKLKDWPMSPGDLNTIYDKVILPPLRTPDRTDALRAAWMKRIQQETTAREEFAKKPENPKKGEEPRIGMKDAMRPPEVTKFVEEGYPDLLWKMEVDVFKAGDQRGAALRMFQHLEKYVAHPKAGDWTKEFGELLDPPKEGEAEAVPSTAGR